MLDRFLRELLGQIEFFVEEAVERVDLSICPVNELQSGLFLLKRGEPKIREKRDSLHSS